MKRWLALLTAALLFSGLLGMLDSQVLSARADNGLPQGPRRKVTLSVSLVRHEWLMVRWSNNAIKCRILVDHEGAPTSDEIFTACGPALHLEWRDTPPCQITTDDSTVCEGMYLMQMGSSPVDTQVEVELPPPTVWVDIAGCTLHPPENTCDSVPNLTFRGEEPLPNERILRIQGTLNSQPFSCEGGECTLPLHPTNSQGEPFEFWVDSSFGDSSPHYTGMVRVLPWGNFMDPEAHSNDPKLYYVDILSSQWRGGQMASCQDTWSVLPQVGGPPPWLTSPTNPKELQSRISYYYLAGMLIQNGVVDASHCVNNGLQNSTAANGCGVVAAKYEMMDWQNRFDEEIVKAAADTGVPSQMLKNIFSRESQFWPGMFKNFLEAGLGQLTSNGSDAPLLWNTTFFHQFCPLVLNSTVCDLGFGNLKPNEQNMLRGALVRSVNSTCPNCPVGLDLSQANFSVKVFAESLLGNCSQVEQIIWNYTGLPGGKVSSYVDLWKFTLVNYNAGPGCLSKAIKAAKTANEPLDWEHVSKRLEPVCKAAVSYVQDISQVGKFAPTPTSWVRFSVNPNETTTPGTPGTPALGTGTPTPLPSYQPTVTPQPTQEATPPPTLEEQ